MRKLFSSFIALVLLSLAAAFSVAAEPTQAVVDVGEVELTSVTDPGALALITEPDRPRESPGAEYAIDNFGLITASVSGLMPMPSGGAAASGHYMRSLS